MFARGLIAAFVLLAACEVADEDRCPEGFVYIPDNMVCACPDGYTYESEDEACVEVPVDTETEEDTDSGTEEMDTSGFGELCEGDADCEEFPVVDFCVINPLSEEGYCTIGDCEVGDCPNGWQCCDCLDLLKWIACLDDEYAAKVEGFGCTCE